MRNCQNLKRLLLWRTQIRGLQGLSLIFELQFAVVAQIAVESSAALGHRATELADPARKPTHFGPTAITVAIWFFGVHGRAVLKTIGPGVRTLARKKGTRYSGCHLHAKQLSPNCGDRIACGSRRSTHSPALADLANVALTFSRMPFPRAGFLELDQLREHPSEVQSRLRYGQVRETKAAVAKGIAVRALGLLWSAPDQARSCEEGRARRYGRNPCRQFGFSSVSRAQQLSDHRIVL